MPKLEVTLLTGRTIDQGTGKEYGKLTREYFESVTICQMDPEDMERLGVRANENVKVTTNYGSVVVKAIPSTKAPHRKIAFVPYGPWVNLVMNPQTHGTGMPSLKGISAEIKPARDEEVLSLLELLKVHYGKR
jgi:formylmethanofuran dehydrogenase subunit D